MLKLIIGLSVFVLFFIIYRKIQSRYIKGNISLLKSPIIIFDFDGTICDDIPLMISLYNDLTDKYNLKKITDNDLKQLVSMSPLEAFKILKIPKWKLPLIIMEIRLNMKSHIHTLKPFKQIDQILKFLHKNKASIVLLTSNSYENVSLFFDNHNLHFFNVVCTKVNFLKKGSLLKKISKKLNKQSKQKSKIFYVGDEIRDIEACKEAAIPIISVAWGMSSLKDLEKYNPDYLCSTTQNLYLLLKKTYFRIVY